MIKSILSVLTLAMATATIFLGVRGGYAVIASRIDPGVPPVVMEDKESRPVPEKSGASISNFEDIGRRNLFKTVNEAAPAVAEVVKTKDSDPNSLEKTKMKLKLWGTVTGADQMTFAIITVALVAGSVADRLRFSAFLLFCVFWLLLVFLGAIF